MSGDRVAKW